MRRALLVLALIALAAPLAATGERTASEKTSGSVLAIQTSKRGDFLVSVDANSLKPVSKPLPLGGHAYAWSFSPDGRRLALGVDRAHGVRIVDLRRMKRVATIQTWSSGIPALAWVAPRRIIGWEPAGLILLDPTARKRLASPETPGNVLVAQRSGNRLVLLTAPPSEAGPTQLAVVGGDGAVRTVRLDRIRASGATTDEIDEFYRPALVLDPTGRAYVVGAGRNEPVAEVELEGLSVTYHELRREQSILSRLWHWLEPVAEAKEPVPGSFRTGAWLGEGKLAVWGNDSVPGGPGRIETKPAGLSVIDTKEWTIRLVDADVWHAAFAGGTLLATYQGHGGLSGFDRDGDRRYRVFEGGVLGVVGTFGSRAFVAFDRKPLHVIDATTGRVLGTRRTMPRLLHPSFFTW